MYIERKKKEKILKLEIIIIITWNVLNVYISYSYIVKPKNKKKVIFVVVVVVI